MDSRHERSARWVFGVLLAAASISPAITQTQTVGLFVHDDRAFEGYTLMSPQADESTFLITNDGLVAHEWATGHNPSHMGYLLENGNLLRVADLPGFGLIQEFDWDGNLVWEFTVDDAVMLQHHDIEPLPNGNVLMIVSTFKNVAEAIAAGRDPQMLQNGLTPDGMIEIQPIPPDSGQIVWAWSAWDHLIQDFDPTKANFGVVADHPELIDINAGEAGNPAHMDIHHANGIAYNASLDQIVLTVRHFSEFWVIDHSTTAEEAAGHTGGASGKGGDLLYRWGNPEMYGRGTADDQILYFPHDAQWIAPGSPGAGNFIVFNNGKDRPGPDYSSIDEVVPPVDEHGAYSIDPDEPFGPAEPVWSYSSPPDFFSPFIAGVERQPDGTSLICEGWFGHLFEVTTEGEIVWHYVNPVYANGRVAQGDPVPNSNKVFKIRRYSPSYPGLVGRDLTPGDPLELFQTPVPVPDGSLMASRSTLGGDLIRVEWDATSCTSADYQLLFGELGQVSSHSLSGAECELGLSGIHAWTGVPAGSLYFLVVGTDESGIYESSWGLDSLGAQRNGYTASFQCNSTTKVVSSTCP